MIFGIFAGVATADDPPAQGLRIATFNTELSRKGPGLLLRDILRGEAQVQAVVAVIAETRPDIVLLQDFDFDHGRQALTAFADLLRVQGVDYPFVFALRPNSGRPTGLDLDGDGRLGHARDAQGYGQFSGQGGMALLSRYPVEEEGVRDFSPLLWAELPGAEGVTRPDVLPDAFREVQRLSAVAHWLVPVATPKGRVNLLAFHASPPVFDGLEDRNGYRNADELRLWLALLAGQLGPVPDGPVVLLGDANNDPTLGEGQKPPLLALLRHPDLQDPLAAKGPTVNWAQTGPMRVDYVLPSRDVTVIAAGISDADPAASRHRLVWVDIKPP
ncbi:MAG: endonuclease/exonuclease/phosphatase family protein [Pseudomonadota bacterium]|nr:endonuclease/exonuclease/phosphatase family protein [Pseudomonadota bacterium]